MKRFVVSNWSQKPLNHDMRMQPVDYELLIRYDLKFMTCVFDLGRHKRGQ